MGESSLPGVARAAGALVANVADPADPANAANAAHPAHATLGTRAARAFGTHQLAGLLQLVNLLGECFDRIVELCELEVNWLSFLSFRHGCPLPLMKRDDDGATVNASRLPFPGARSETRIDTLVLGLQHNHIVCHPISQAEAQSFTTSTPTLHKFFTIDWYH